MTHWLRVRGWGAVSYIPALSQNPPATSPTPPLSPRVHQAFPPHVLLTSSISEYIGESAKNRRAEFKVLDLYVPFCCHPAKKLGTQCVLITTVKTCTACELGHARDFTFQSRRTSPCVSWRLLLVPFTLLHQAMFRAKSLATFIRTLKFNTPLQCLRRVLERYHDQSPFQCEKRSIQGHSHLAIFV